MNLRTLRAEHWSRAYLTLHPEHHCLGRNFDVLADRAQSSAHALDEIVQRAVRTRRYAPGFSSTSSGISMCLPYKRTSARTQREDGRPSALPFS